MFLLAFQQRLTQRRYRRQRDFLPRQDLRSTRPRVEEKEEGEEEGEEGWEEGCSERDYLAVQRRVHVAGRDGVDADAVRGPLRGEGSGQLGHGGLGGVVGALLLRVQDAGGGDGGEEDDGAAGAGGGGGGHHVAGAGLGDEEGAREVGVEEGAEEGRVVGFGFYVGALGPGFGGE